MKHTHTPLAAVIAAVIIFILAAVPARGEKVGLVLSGGGAKGIAHVGVIKALEDNDIPIDYITGTSMGAIVGSLYACGFTPEEMMQLFTSSDFTDWSTGTLNRRKIYYVERADKTPKMFNINFGRRDSTNIFSYIPSHLFSPMPMNMEFLKLFGPYTVQCRENFDSLMVPFRCVTSDIYHKHKIVCRDGSLGEAVRQSMSFPLVFKPIERDGLLVYDGGIYDNFPVDVMAKDFAPGIMIGSNVSGPDGKPIPDNVYSQLEDMIIQNNDYSLPDSLGVKLDVPVRQFGVLEFDKARKIYEIGYATAMKQMPEIKRRVKARRSREDVQRRRDNFNNHTRVLKFDSIAPVGVGRPEREYLSYVFNPLAQDSVTVDQVENAYYRVVSGNDVSDLEPQMRISGDKKILVLKPRLNDRWNVGMGAWLTTATNSMLYLTGSYSTMRFKAIEASISGWLGQSYLAGMADFKINLRRQEVSYLQFQGVLSRQKYYNDQVMFFKNNAPTFLTDFENYARINYVRALSRISLFRGSVGYAFRRYDYFAGALEDNSRLSRDKSRYRTWMIGGAIEANTLNSQMYPSDGMEFNLSLYGLHDEENYQEHDTPKTDNYTVGYKGLLLATWRRYWDIGHNLIVGAGLRGAATVGPLRQNYVAELIHSPEFAPTPSMVNYFNPAFRNPNFVAVGFMPVWNPMSNLQARGDFYYYTPVHNIRPVNEGRRAVYDGWFRDPQFFGELALVYNFSFASLSIYGNYMSSPSDNFNFGISFGLLLPAPRFLR